MTAETISEKDTDRHQLPYLEYVALSLSGNCHSQLLIHDGIIISHNYDTDYSLLSS
jgi:hypothetical protein